MKRLIVFLFALALVINAQLKLTIKSDKDSYEYGESIRVICTLENDADTSVTFYASNYTSCQAEFILNDFYSEYWESCLPTVEEIVFPSHSKRTYSWTIDPYVLGIPNIEGEQTLTGYFKQGWNSFDTEHLKDTTTFSAPMFLGGQLNLNYNSTNKTGVDSIQNYYNAEVLDSSEFSGSIDETWQLSGCQIDTVKLQLENSGFINYVEYKRFVAYDSVIVTSVNSEDKTPNEIQLLQNYPNPFNPNTTIKFTIPGVETTRRVVSTKLVVYDILGREIKTLLNKKLTPGRYEVEFNGENLSSGVYFFRLTNGNYTATKKMLLLR